MQPPETPSTEPIVEQDAAASEPRSAESAESSSGKAPSLWNRLFGSKPAESTEDDKADSDQDAAASAQPASKTITLTEDELARKVQAETDRRESRRAQEAREAEKRRLRKEDPYAYVEQEEQAEAQQQTEQQFTSFIQDVGKAHDGATLDVLVSALPPAEATRIFKLEGAGVGLDGRKLIVAESLKALEKHWKAEGKREAEHALRGNVAFRKQVFAEARDTTEEPDLIEGTPQRRNGDFMDQILTDYKRAKGRA